MKLLILVCLLGASVVVNAHAAQNRLLQMHVFDSGRSGFVPLGQSNLAKLYGKGLPGFQPIIRIRIRPKVRLWDSSSARSQLNNTNVRYGLGNTQLNIMNVITPVSK